MCEAIEQISRLPSQNVSSCSQEENGQQLIAANPFFHNLMTAVRASSYSTFDLSLLLFPTVTIHFAGGHMGAN